MPAIRLLRAVTDPGNRGPSRGMFTLQKALREANVPWLKVGGHLQPGDIPWIWSWQDAPLAVQWEKFGWDFVLGPNVLFANSKRPGVAAYEKELLDAEHCLIQLTESDWYSGLIRDHCNHNEAPIKIFHYPIDPEPEGPLPAEYDLMVYLKDRTLGREVCRLQQRWPNSRVVVYGHYQRDEMIAIARRSRACCYLNHDDRGPLAAAEIALAGASLIGVERGCPWVCQSGLGVEVKHFGTPVLFEAVEQAMAMDREQVREAARRKFDTSKQVQIILSALEPIAMGDA